MFDLNLEGGPNKVSPLHIACNLYYIQIMEMLIDGGADLFIENDLCEFPRSLAIHSLF